MDVPSVEARGRPEQAVDDDGSRSRPLAAIGAIVVISLIGSVLLLLGSPHGIHASPDSFTYLGAASSLSAGDGWTYPYGDAGAPVTLFPPVYPLLLVVPELLGISVFDWVLWQNAVFLAGFSFLVGLSVFEATKGLVAAAVAMILVQIGTPTIVVFAHIWSETLFYPIVIVVLASLGRYLADGGTSWLVTAAVGAGVGMLTRYAGLSLLLTACVFLVAWPPRRAWDRLRRPAVFAAIAIPVNALWVWRNYNASRTLTGNNNLVHGLTGSDVIAGLETVRSWFVPSRSGGVVAALIILLAAALAIVVSIVVRTLLRNEGVATFHMPPIVVVCLGYALMHFAFIAVANAYSTRSPPFNDRILGSVFAPIVVAVVVSGQAFLRALPRDRVLRLALVVLGASLVLASLSGLATAIEDHYGTERGSLPLYRRLSASLDDALSRGSTLYSNRANIAWFMTGRPIASLPRSCAGGQVLPNPTYDQELRDVRDSVGDAPLQVIFFQRSPRCEPFSMEGLKRTLRLERVGPAGEVFVLQGPTAPSDGA
jgi:hypothetical protein